MDVQAREKNIFYHRGSEAGGHTFRHVPVRFASLIDELGYTLLGITVCSSLREEQTYTGEYGPQ